MFSALFSFLGGTAFRMIWGEVSAWLNKKLEHEQEMERLRAQEGFDQAKHQRALELMRASAEVGLKELQVKADADADRLAAEAFANAMKTANTPTGVKWIDGWNGAIRPSAATVALVLWIGHLIEAAFVLTDWDRELVGAVLGYFFADRSLAKRAK